MIDFYPNFVELNNKDKLVKVLNPSTPMQIRTFIKQLLKMREGGQMQS